MRLHLTHATLNFGVNARPGPELVTMIDEALADGLDVTLDTYPYLPGSTSLVALLPRWATAGGPELIMERLADPRDPGADRVRVGGRRQRGLPRLSGGLEHRRDQRGGRSGAVRGGRTHDRPAGHESGSAPSEVYADLLLRDRLATTILQHVGNEENVRAIMQHPVHTGGSDAILVGEKPHPRAWGTFPRYLGHYVRELGVLGLEECIHHLTGRAAARLDLVDRGLVRVGHHADLVLFDPDLVRDTATFAQPRQQPEGIDWVLVNGEPVIDGGCSRTGPSPVGRCGARQPARAPRTATIGGRSTGGGSSAGQSRGLIIPGSRVRAPPAPQPTKRAEDRCAVAGRSVSVEPSASPHEGPTPTGPERWAPDPSAPIGSMVRTSVVSLTVVAESRTWPWTSSRAETPSSLTWVRRRWQPP